MCYDFVLGLVPYSKEELLPESCRKIAATTNKSLIRCGFPAIQDAFIREYNLHINSRPIVSMLYETEEQSDSKSLRITYTAKTDKSGYAILTIE